MNMDTHITFLRQVNFCTTLDEATLHALARIATPSQRPAGTMIQLEGEPADAMYIVTQGRVKVTRLSTRGREQVLFVAIAGQHFNAVPVFDGGPCPANAEALTDVSLLALPAAALRRVIEEHPPLASAFLAEFGTQLRHLVNLVDRLALHTVQGRLARLLVEQAEAAAPGKTLPPLTQSDMAARLGTVREMVARTLKGFEVQGLIRLDHGVITVLDKQGLAAQAEH